jgi:hypothetical protein
MSVPAGISLNATVIPPYPGSDLMTVPGDSIFTGIASLLIFIQFYLMIIKTTVRSTAFAEPAALHCAF